MQQRGRPVDPVFLLDESLFRRCQKSETDGRRLLPDAIGFRDWSVNRGKYSEPRDVLLPHWTDWGVAAFEVRDIPPSLESSGGVIWNFKMHHKPEEANYAHSVI